MFLTILRCVGEAVGHKGLAALAASAIPLGGFLYEIAEDALERYRRRRQMEQFREDLQALVQAEMAEIRQQAQEIAAEVVPPGTPSQQQKQLELYLTMVPLAARQTFRRPEDPQGRSVPAHLDLSRPENFVQILPPRSPRFEIGQRVPHAPQWELVQPLGLGGFGEVWLARHTFLGEQRAFKFCLEPRYQERLLRYEGEVVRRVMGMKDRFPADGHGIVWLLDAYLEGETPWLAYEYVEGGDLAAVIRKMAELEPRQRGRWAMEYLQALARIVGEFHALEPPIVHRDLKPANVLLRRTAKGVVLRVTDFGISQLAAEHAVGQTRVQSRWVTQCSLVRGAYTPLYASPQQRRGERADPRDDVYSLGVIGWQMLYGDTTAERPTARTLRRVAEQCRLPSGVLEVLERSWEDEAGERPAGGRELWRQLREALGSARVSETRVLPSPPVFRGQLVHKLEGHRDVVWRVAVSGDGGVVVSGDLYQVLVWDGVSGQLRHRLEGHEGWVKCVSVSGDGGVVVSG
ncbi:MAG: serine/threonine-protein kinase, partial [Thermogemmata sp.]